MAYVVEKLNNEFDYVLKKIEEIIQGFGYEIPSDRLLAYLHIKSIILEKKLEQIEFFGKDNVR